MVKILHLYPNLMNLYGDYANVVVLKKHLEDQGVKVKVIYKEIGDKYNPNDYDFIYMGSGSDNNVLYALKDIVKHSKEFKKYVTDNKVMLFTGNAMELLGSSIDGKKALGIFDFNSEQTNKRYTGDVILAYKDMEIVGFINKSSVICNGEDSKLFDYIFMDNNLVDNKYEGCNKNNLFGTHVIGPILVKNPCFMKMIVCKLLPKNKEYKDIVYPFEEDSYDVTLKALKGRM